MEYIVRHHDASFVDALPSLSFPHELGSATRAFEMQGADMQPTVRHQDVLLTCRVDKATLRLRAGRLYAFVLQNQLVVRRLVEHRSDNVLRLRADNPDYPVQDLPFTDALEVWEVQGVFSTYLRPPALVEERVTRLERQVEELLARLG
ncbi:helix-turn-helix transcriptional regulator [Hymenobacter sp. AT01-02]|uniref:S24 family peptidase n=1 Tax=Hymenobacter sp. AT01-02 TaxID=1571877 RepID=UPI0005F1230B|nr:S24 family peptidase [Hymenobacter sp. AT01-02]